MSTDFKQDPILVMPGGGDELLMGGSHFLHKVKSEDTKGVFSVIEIISPPGKGVSLHVHEQEDELVYLLDGEIEVTLGDQTMTAVAGVIIVVCQSFLARSIPLNSSFPALQSLPSGIISRCISLAFP